MISNLKPSDFDFWSSINTRWGDMDSLGHLNHTAYLSYMETARVSAYRDLGFSGIRKDADESTILANMEVQYHKQASHPDTLKIGHRICRVGSKSFDTLSAIFRDKDNELICSALFKLVSFNYKINKTINVPDAIRKNCRVL